MNYTVTKSIEIKKGPVVVIPIAQWQEIEDRLEEAEALSSKTFLKRIAKDRERYHAGHFIEYAKLRKGLKLA